MLLRLTTQLSFVLLAAFCACALSGCGGDDSAPAASETGESGLSDTDGQSSLPTASIGSPPTESQDNVRIAPPEEGTPEWCILQIIRLSQAPMPETDDVAELREVRKERNTEIIRLATEAIAQTHSEPAKEQVFNTAVHRLMAATAQLAMQGDRDRIDELYGHAEALYDRDPNSRAASEAGWAVARFANEFAATHEENRVQWLQSFARQSLLFADRFPFEKQRAIKLLDDAGTSCDAWSLTEEATQCFMALRDRFPETPQAEQAAGPLRRLSLPGNPLDLGGPTIDGGFVEPSMFANQPLLIVFWSSQAKPFLDNARHIIGTAAKYERHSLQVIGVNLDTDEASVKTFLQQHGVKWQNIFHTDPARRGWNSPVASYYGVRNIPQLWVVDSRGTVVSTSVQPDNLDAALERLFPLQASR